jgi:hypothetical protein
LLQQTEGRLMITIVTLDRSPGIRVVLSIIAVEVNIRVARIATIGAIITTHRVAFGGH